MCDVSVIPEGKDWIDIIAAFFPIIISGFAVYFTFAQFKLAAKKRKDELFDKRFPVYDRLVRWCGEIYHEGGYTAKLHRDLIELKHESHFLFGKAVSSLFDEIEEKYREIGTYKMEGKPLHPDKTRNELPEYKELIEYFLKLQSTAQKAFKEYMEVQK